MKTSTALTLAGLGGLALYLSRSESGGVGGGGAVGGNFPFPVGGGTAPDPLDIVGDALAMGEDFWLAAGTRNRGATLDHHAGGEAADANDLQALRASHRWRADLFRKTVQEPASRIPITSLTVDHYKAALAFLANGFSREGVPLTYGQTVASDNLRELEIINEINKIAIPLASALTFGIYGIVEQVSLASYDASISTEERAYNEKIGYVGKTLTERSDNVSRAWRAGVSAAPVFNRNVSDLGIFIKPEGEDAANAAAGVNVYTDSVDDPWTDGAGPSMDFGWDPTTYPEGGRFFFGVGLLKPAPSGLGAWKYPWISRETGYASGDPNDKRPTADRIVRIAYLYRALDVLRGLLAPSFTWHESGVAIAPSGIGPDGVPFVTVGQLAANLTRRVPKGLYAYRIGGFSMWGCCLPAHVLDRAVNLVETPPTKDTRFLPTPVSTVAPGKIAGAFAGATDTVSEQPTVSGSSFLLRRGIV